MGVHCSSKSCSLSLIGCFTIRVLRGEDELASSRLGMLYKVSQEVFPGVGTTCLAVNAPQPHASP